MPRPSLRQQRRQQLVEAFERVLADHGFEGATITRLAMEAGVSPGIVHHYFVDKDELSLVLLRHLTNRMRRRLRDADSLDAVLGKVLRLDDEADPTAAKAWVGVWAEAIRKPDLRRALRRAVRGARDRFVAAGASEELALALLALVVGFLLLGALDAELTRGRAARIAIRVASRWK